MKILLLMPVVLFFISCNSGDKNESFKNLDILEEESAPPVASMEVEPFRYELLTREKLQDYFDLLVLEQNHPEFKDEISRQIKSISADSIGIPLHANKITITNLKQITEIEKVSDTLQRFQLSFDVITESTTTKDTLWAIISSKRVLLDDREVTATKVRFRKLNTQ